MMFSHYNRSVSFSTDKWYILAAYAKAGYLKPATSDNAATQWGRTMNPSTESVEEFPLLTKWVTETHISLKMFYLDLTPQH